MELITLILIVSLIIFVSQKKDQSRANKRDSDESASTVRISTSSYASRQKSSVSPDSVWLPQGKSIKVAGRSDTKLINDLLSSSSKYSNTLPYFFLATGDSYNSNSYVRGVLLDAGINHVNPPKQFWYPGWNKPIPLSACKK